MKTRIRVETAKNGKSIYYPQYKTFLFWHYFRYLLPLDFADAVRFSTLEEAKEYITRKKLEYREEAERKRAQKEDTKIVSIKYIGQ